MDTVLGNLFVGGLLFLAAAGLLLPVLAAAISRVRLPQSYQFKKLIPTLVGMALGMILLGAWVLAH